MFLHTSGCTVSCFSLKQNKSKKKMIEQVKSFTVGIFKAGEYCNSIVSFAEEVDVSVLLISLPIFERERVG